MGNQASTIANAGGSWVGRIAAHLVALIIAPIVNQVNQQTSPPNPLEARMDALIKAATSLSRQVELLREDLAARQEPFVYEMAIRAVPPRRRRRRGHVDDTE